MPLTHWLRGVFGQQNRSLAPGRSKKRRYSTRPRLEHLEDRLAPAANISIIQGSAGAGTLDQFLSATDGTIAVTDAPGDTAATLSTGALQSVNVNVPISVTAENSITFNNVGNIALQTGAENSATFATVDQTALGQNVTLSGNTVLSAAGGNLILRAGDDLTVATTARLQTSGIGTITLAVDFGDADPGVGQTLTVPGASLQGAARAFLTGGSLNDTFNIDSLSSVPINLTGGGEMPLGANLVEVRVGTTTVSVTGPIGDVVNVNDSASTVGHSYSLNIDALQSAPLAQSSHGVIHFIQVETVNLTTTAANGRVGVVGSPAQFSRIFNTANSTVSVFDTGDNEALIISGSSAGYDLHVRGTGDGSVLTATGSTQANFFQVLGSGAGSGVQLDGNAANDKFYIDGLGDDGILSLNGNGGNDLFAFGSPSGLLNNIAGQVAANGGAGLDTLYVNEQGNIPGRTYNLDAAQLTRTDLANFALMFQAMENLQLLSGAGADTVNLNGQTAGMSVGLYTGRGNDTIQVNVFDNSGYNKVIVDGGSELATLIVTDRSGGAVQKRNTKAFQPTGFVTTTYPTKPGSKTSFVQFTNMAAVVLTPDNT